MLRVFLTVLVPLLLPTLVWIGYMALERRRLAAAGGGDRPWHAGLPWPKLLLAGIALMLATLAVLTSIGGGMPGDVYRPAHMGPDGKLVPAQTAPAPRP